MELDQSDRIVLKGIHVYAYVGVLAHERVEGQNFYLDLALYQGYSRAGLTDDLDHTVSYAEVALLAKQVVAQSSRQLLEALAEDLAREILAAYPRLYCIDVTIHKPEAPIETEFSDVTYSIRRYRTYPVRLGLGSNLGDRRAYIQAAVESLKAHPQIYHLRQSRIFESKAWGLEDQGDFLNAVVACETSLTPWDLLHLCQDLEEAAQRERKIHWGPRTLDVDILSYGDLRSTDPDLLLPHPYREERNFVQLPLYELDHPSLERTPDMHEFSSPTQALLVVDCQHDFISGSLACQHSEEAVRSIVAYINAHPDLQVAYSLDWHSPQNGSFKKNGGIWPDHCVQDTPGAELDSAFTSQVKNPAQRPGPLTNFYKGRDDQVEEYSAYAAKRADGKAIHEVLAKHVTVVGLASEYCIRESILALAQAGFTVDVYLPGVGYVDEEDHLKNIADLKDQGFRVFS